MARKGTIRNMSKVHNELAKIRRERAKREREEAAAATPAVAPAAPDASATTPAADAVKHDRTAAQAYAGSRSDIARLLDVLGMELDRHGEAAKADAKNWGRVGDLDKVRHDLIEIVAFMSGMGCAAVEEFLDDANAE